LLPNNVQVLRALSGNFGNYKKKLAQHNSKLFTLMLEDEQNREAGSSPQL